MPVQRPIQFEFNIQQTFDNFYSGSNQEAVSLLSNAVIHQTEQLIFLWSLPGLGKSHLLNACCRMAHQVQSSAFIYSFNDQSLPSVRLLDNLDSIAVVCFDNINCLAGHTEWEQAFFNFFNRHRDNDHQLILSSNSPPNYLTFQLADLKTRLNWGLTLKLQALTDAENLAALNVKADSLGFKISPEVGRFLMTRFARDLPSLWVLLQELDQASLTAKRKLTVPFLKSFLENQCPQ